MATAKKTTAKVDTDAKKVAAELAAEDKKTTAAAKKTTAAAKKAPAKKATATKTTTAAKKTTTKKTTKVSFVEFDNKQLSVEEIIEKAEADFKENNKRKAMGDLKVYIKPAENKAFYVVTSGKTDILGSVDL